jgi:4-amino-4-deoxy-L-arabinose transferase-like glycosyltransferase
MIRDRAQEIRHSLVVALSAAVFYAIGIGAGSHFNSDDTLYAEMAREMVQSGDYVDNRWLGVVHFEKPPLLLWSLAAAGAAFGFGEAALRWAVTSWSILGLVAFYLLARSLALSARAALTATALLACSTFYLLLTRRLMTDIPLLACALAAAACSQRRAHLASGVFAGLCVMAKSAAALPLLGAVYGYGLAMRQLDARAALRSAGSALAVAAPWHLLAFMRHGNAFLHGYLGHHVSERLTQGVVPGLSLIERIEVLSRERVLLALALIGIVVAVRRRAELPAQRFALLWLALSGVPVLLSATVLPHYFLPLAPAFALLAVTWLPTQSFEHRLAPGFAAAAVLASLLADPGKLVWWLDPDFSPDVKAVGVQLSKAATERDTIVAYNLMSSGLVFYSGGLGVAIYSDDARFLDVQRRVLMTQRQAGHKGALFDLRSTALPDAGAAHRFVVTQAGDAAVAKLERLLREQFPERPLFRLDAGELCLFDDAGVGRLVAPIPEVRSAHTDFDDTH